MNPLVSPVSYGVHNSDWSAWGWIGALALFLLGGAIAFAAVTIGRMSYWIYDDRELNSTRHCAIAVFVAIGLWALSLWPLLTSLGALARHSRSTEFAGWFTIGGTVVLAACYMLAVPASNWLAFFITGRDYSGRDTPDLLFLAILVPALVTVLIGFGVLTGEKVYREGASSVLFELLLSAALLAGFLYCLWKAAIALKHIANKSY
ncbi:hypothetical protein ACFVWF_28040 [Rhodococcus qingshengii]|uniref:hypothetical protein n=1 Tax=Rhodococcus qingshengii TaxID=334542 RepID=UPI0036DACDCE